MNRYGEQLREGGGTKGREMILDMEVAPTCVVSGASLSFGAYKVTIGCEYARARLAASVAASATAAAEPMNERPVAMARGGEGSSYSGP